MRNTEKNNGKPAREGLSHRIGRAFNRILRRALVIVCLESLLLSGILAVLYTLKKNSSSVVEYTKELDQAMQSKVSMLEAIASGISSGTIQAKEDVLDYDQPAAQ